MPRKKQTGQGELNFNIDRPAMPVLTFGKHKGKRLDEVYFKNPDYIEWGLKNLSIFPALVAQMHAAEPKTKPKRRKKKESKPLFVVARKGYRQPEYPPWYNDFYSPSLDIIRSNHRPHPFMDGFVRGEFFIDPDFDPDEGNRIDAPY